MRFLNKARGGSEAFLQSCILWTQTAAVSLTLGLMVFVWKAVESFLCGAVPVDSLGFTRWLDVPGVMVVPFLMVVILRYVEYLREAEKLSELVVSGSIGLLIGLLVGTVVMLSEGIVLGALTVEVTAKLIAGTFLIHHYVPRLYANLRKRFFAG